MSFSFGRVSLSYLCLILAASCARASSNKIWTEFSGDKALAHVQRLVDLGPRRLNRHRDDIIADFDQAPAVAMRGHLRQVAR